MARKTPPAPEPDPGRYKAVNLTLDADARADIEWITANVPGIHSRSAAVRAAAAFFRGHMEGQAAALRPERTPKGPKRTK